MGSEIRRGKRQLRSQRTNRRVPELGYYLIVTDTEETERIYFNGLRDSIKNEVGDKLIIKVAETQNINFDKIIENAEMSGIKVAWSNPCIETWFMTYFGKMPYCQDSVSCCHQFSKEYKKNVGQEYHKADPKLYSKLTKNGDEEAAISLAEKKYKEHLKKENGTLLPSEMIPATTVHLLVSEIKCKR